MGSVHQPVPPAVQRAVAASTTVVACCLPLACPTPHGLASHTYVPPSHVHPPRIVPLHRPGRPWKSRRRRCWGLPAPAPAASAWRSRPPATKRSQSTGWSPLCCSSSRPSAACCLATTSVGWVGLLRLLFVYLERSYAAPRWRRRGHGGACRSNQRARRPTFP